MKNIKDLIGALSEAFNKDLIENFFVSFSASSDSVVFIDVDFFSRDEKTQTTIFQLKDYILANYPKIRSIDYMPILHRLRLYVDDQQMVLSDGE